MVAGGAFVLSTFTESNTLGEDDGLSLLTFAVEGEMQGMYRVAADLIKILR